MPTQDMESPFASAALDYLAAGWTVIPLGTRPGMKTPPPKGFTGWAGHVPSGADVQAWIEGPEGRRNIAVRFPDTGIVAVDFDVAGRQQEIESAAGVPFPRTWTSTARGADSPRRQRFYRAALPEGRVWLDHPRPGVDMCHIGHRYSVVWPSTNPDAGGARYEWYDPEGELYEGVPELSEIPWLDDRLVKEMSQDGQPMEGSAVGSEDARATLASFRRGPACPRVRKLLGDEMNRIEAGKTGGSIREPGKLHALVSYGIEGHAGVAEALTEHQRLYVAAREQARGEDPSSSSADWWRQVCGSIGKKLTATGGTIAETCGCQGAPAPARSHPGADGEAVAGEVVTPGAQEVTRARNELPSPNNPARAARELAGRLPASDGHSHVQYWREDWWLWEGSRYVKRDADEMEQWLYQQTEHARYFKPAGDPDPEAVDDMITEPGPDDAGEWLAWLPNMRKIAEVRNAMAKLVLLRTGDDERVLACRNGVVEVREGAVELLPHTPARFNLNALDFDFDPSAECPMWFAFLEQVLPGDRQAHDFLGEWFGYVLSGRTDQEKIASLIGESRGGKGTIADILQYLLGRDAVAAPNLEGLGTQFGAEGLVDRSLAVMSDVRWNVKTSWTALERLLMISGQDHVSIPRKHKSDWSGKSGVRFMMLSNDTPQFSDRSNAIGNRMIHVKFRVSFVGREDFGLKARLKTEAAGILNWALAGLARLEAHGTFTVPESGLEVAQEMKENSNPIGIWVEEMCEMVPGYSGPNDTAFRAYLAWASTRNMTVRHDIRGFMAGLRELKLEGVDARRENRKLIGGRKVPMITGLKWPELGQWTTGA